MYDVKRLVAALAITTAAVGLSAGPATAAPSSAAPQLGSDTSQAAGWLVEQLVGPDKDHFTFPGGDFADDGNTADGLLALDAAGVGHDAAARMLAWLQADAGNYVGAAPNYYPGSLAKLLIVAEAEGVDAHDFTGDGSLDLVAAITGTENTGADPATTGLYQNPDSQYGYESTITQALSLLALSDTGNPADAPSPAAVQWLLDQQCPDGGFRNNEPPHTPSGCTSGVETTAFAVQGLAAVGQDVTDALAWLDGQQNGDGGFGSPASNANATALAAQAYLAANAEPTDALLWIRDHQVGCEVDSDADQAKVGAITFDDSGYDHDTALRATTQALQAMALHSLVTIDATGAAADVERLFCVASPVGGGVGDGGGNEPRRNHRDECPAAGAVAGDVDPESLQADPESADADPESSLAASGTAADADPCNPPVLAATGRDLGMQAGIAVDLVFVGALVAFAARRRRRAA